MPIDKRELYSSPNGDKWFLVCDRASGNIFIRHEPNVPSGGRMTEIDIGAFLSRGERNPEHQALLRLIGTLLDRRAQDTRRGADRRGGGEWPAALWTPVPCSAEGAPRPVTLALGERAAPGWGDHLDAAPAQLGPAGS